MTDLNKLRKTASGIKLIVSDLDDTLLTSDKTVSPRTLAAIEAVRKKGVVFTICTGRNFAMLHRFPEMAGVRGLMLSCNGAELADAGTGEMLRQALLPSETAIAVARLLRSLCLPFAITGRDECWLRPEDTERRKAFEAYNMDSKRLGFPLFGINTLGESLDIISDKPILKLLFACDDEMRFQKVSELCDSLGACIITSGENFHEVQPKGESKGNGLHLLAKQLGLRKDECCAFGDYRNDVAMLDAAGLPIAMCNALSEVKARAKYITEYDYDHDGVGRALEELFL